MKRIKSIFIILILFSGLIFGFATTPVLGVSVYSLDYGWELVNDGSENITSGLFETQIDSSYGREFQVTNNEYHIGISNINNHSFWIDFDSGLGDDVGWWNISTSFSYISQISFWYKHTTSGGTPGNPGNELNFYDVSDNLVLRLSIGYSDEVYFYDYDNNQIQIIDGGETGYTTWNEIRISHVSGNSMNYSVYNETGVWLGGSTDSTQELNDWDNFVYIFFESGGNAPTTSDIYFDDFTITTSGFESEWETCTGNSYIIEKRFSNSIGYWNQTLNFRVYKSNIFYADIKIFNSTGSIIYSHPSTTIPVINVNYRVDMNDGDGTFYIKARNQGASDWAVSCPFTILSDTTIGDWNIFTNEFDRYTDPIINVKGKSGESAQIDLKISLDATYTLIDNFSTTGSYQVINPSFEIRDGTKYVFYLYNNSDDSLVHIHTYTTPIIEFDYTLFINDKKYDLLYWEDNQRFHGVSNVIDYDFSIRVYDGVYNEDNSSLMNFGVHTDAGGNFYKIFTIPDGLNEDSTYYAYLCLEGQPILDGGHVTFKVKLTGLDDTVLGDTWYGLPFWLPYLIGIFITLFITMSPLIIGTYISRNTRMTKVSIPPLLYVGFFFFGLIVSVLMDFLPSWLPFVILFGMITFFAVQWLYGKKGEIAGE